jgi:flagellar biosynthesis/type III secretory pathway protein FliH
MTTDISLPAAEALARVFDEDALRIQGKSEALEAFYHQVAETLRAQAARITELEAAHRRCVPADRVEKELAEVRETAHEQGIAKGLKRGFWEARCLVRELAREHRGSYGMAADALTWKVFTGNPPAAGILREKRSG